jgi:undecaprenyl-diphosphatase
VVQRWLLLLSPSMLAGAVLVVLTRFVRRSPSIPRELSLDQSLTAHAPGWLVGLSHAVDVQHWAFVVVGVSACLLIGHRYRQALLLFFAAPVAEGLNLALKVAVNRQLPDQAPEVGLGRLDVLLFPSGHVVRATVTMGLLIAFVVWPHLRLRWLGLPAALLFVALVGFAQTTVGGHLPLDVVGGFLVGFVLVNLVWVVDHALAERRPMTKTMSGRTVSPTFGFSAARTLIGRPVALALGIALVVIVVDARVPQQLAHFADQPDSANAMHWALDSTTEHAAGARLWLSRLYLRNDLVQHFAQGKYAVRAS